MYREPAVKYTVPFICVCSHICPRHPWAARAVSCREVIKRLAAHQLHGESHPSRGSHATAPIACDGSRQEPLQRSDVRLDGSIIVPAAGRGRTGSHPVLAACCFSLLAWKNKPKTYNLFFRWCLVVFSRQITAQPLPGLWLSPKQRECA